MKHYLRWMNHGDPEFVEYVRGDDHERLWSQVAKSDGCWFWTGRTENGYGYMWAAGKASQLVHRVSYAMLVGPIPAGMTLDHACHTQDELCAGGATCMHRRCVNPAHLSPMTAGANSVLARSAAGRRTSCPAGHPYDEENTYWARSGSRKCKACNRYRAAQRSTGVSDSDWQRALRRSTGRCSYCGERGRLVRDHVIPLSRGGANRIGNLVPTCVSCNNSKGALLLVEWKARRSRLAARAASRT